MTTSPSDGFAPASFLGRLNHVGVAVPSVDEALPLYRRLFGEAAVGAPFDLEAQGVRVAFVDGPNTQIELISPLGAGSAIARFIERNPAGGQHHLCYEVADIEAARTRCEALGLTPLGTPRPGAHGTPVLFLHPRGTGGVLIEMMESPAHG